VLRVCLLCLLDQLADVAGEAAAVSGDMLGAFAQQQVVPLEQWRSPE
jgi:hypothetical protein